MNLIDKMSAGLGMPTEGILLIASTASHRYKHFQIPKARGGSRDIYHPSKPLKTLQRWLLFNVVQKLPVHNAAMAYVTGKNIFQNAKIHEKSRFLLRLDIEDFFPSITRSDIERFISVNPNKFAKWDVTDTSLFCSIVCRRHHLTIGAPTSPALSNVLCDVLDEKLTLLGNKYDCRYTRYADDLFFSTIVPNALKKLEEEVPQILSSLDYPKGLKLNVTKTRHSSMARRRKVTGIVLGTDGKAWISRKFKRKIRGMVHRFSSLKMKEKQSLAGMIAFVVGNEPDFLNRLILKFGIAKVEEALKPTE